MPSYRLPAVPLVLSPVPPPGLDLVVTPVLSLVSRVPSRLLKSDPWVLVLGLARP